MCSLSPLVPLSATQNKGFQEKFFLLDSIQRIFLNLCQYLVKTLLFVLPSSIEVPKVQRYTLRGLGCNSFHLCNNLANITDFLYLKQPKQVSYFRHLTSIIFSCLFTSIPSMGMGAIQSILTNAGWILLVGFSDGRYRVWNDNVTTFSCL